MEAIIGQTLDQIEKELSLEMSPDKDIEYRVKRILDRIEEINRDFDRIACIFRALELKHLAACDTILATNHNNDDSRRICAHYVRDAINEITCTSLTAFLARSYTDANAIFGKYLAQPKDLDRIPF